MLIVAIGSVVPSFLSPYSLGVVAEESSVLLLLAMAETAVLVLGGIDLSVAAIASLTSVLIALLLPRFGLWGLLGPVALATAIGALQGAVHAWAQVPSFIVTLAGLGLWSGVALTIAPATVPIGDGYKTFSWLEQQSVGVPNAFLFGMAVLAAVGITLGRLPLGRYLEAIGKGERAALLSGIRVRRVKVIAFAGSGLCAGLAGMVLAARTSSGNPTLADSLLLPGIAAVVVGGTAISGGQGSLVRTFLGAMTISVMRVGIALTGIDPAYEPIAYGVLVIAAAALTLDRSRAIIVK
jgi:ribose transport system permease protein